MQGRRIGRYGGRGLVALLLTCAATAAVTPPAQALPTASFSYDPTDPLVGQRVTFTFTGSCDDPPCRVQWRAFREGGSTVGTSLGEGEQVSHAFAQPGDHRVVVKVTGAGSTHGSATATQVVSVVSDAPPPPPPVVLDDRDRALELDGWRGIASGAASGGGYRRGRGELGLRFSGRRLDYVAVTGPGLGVAELTLDRRAPRRFDLRSPRTALRTWTLYVPPGRHRLTLRSIGAAVTLDELVVHARSGVARVDDRSPRVTYGRWVGRRSAAAAGGTTRVASSPGARVDVRFSGTAFTWVTATGPDQGRARVVVDGATLAVVDNRTPTAGARRTRTFGGLPDGAHHARIVALDDGPVTSRVTVDAVEVEGRG